MRIPFFKKAGWIPVFFLLLGACSVDESVVVKKTEAVPQAGSPEGRLPSGATVSVFGGGPIYKNRTVSIPDLKASGFTEVVVWNIAVSTAGDLNFNGEFPVCSNGSYTGGNMYPNFASDMQGLKTGTTSVNRVTFSIGSSNVGDFQHIRDLINAQGTGSTSILYRNFQALKTATGADAIDLDDENCYDQSTMVKFCVMLGNLGYSVALCPYTNSSFWTSVASQVNTQRAGTVDQVHLQCYAGGSGNSPCNWNFGSVPVHGSRWSGTTSSVQSKFTEWKNACGTTGGWMWLYDEWVGNGMAAQYATAIKNGLGTTTPPTGTDITNTGGTISAQYTDSPSGEDIARLIDNTSSTKYLTFHSAGWVQFHATTSAVVVKYTITSANDVPARDPKNWTLQGSNNGTSWTTLNTQTNQTFASRFLTKTYTFSNTTSYTYYRLNVTAVGSGSILQMGEWELWKN